MASSIKDLVKKSQEKISSRTSSAPKEDSSQDSGIQITRQDSEYIQGPSKSGI
jgi:hypothetical protein